MCGITGIVNLSKAISIEELERFTDALKHRGPNGRGIWNDDPRFGLGHRRLSILDLSDNGACPFDYTSPSGRRFILTYNGEIYNFIELRLELERKGYYFKTGTDTEVLAASIAEWGTDALDRFNGMWAFAILDEQSKTLLLSRDRFGVKPLYYAIQNNTLYFASELKAFTYLTSFSRELNADLVPHYLNNSQAIEGATEATLYKDVFKLLPGHNLTLRPDGSMKKERWWDTTQHIQDKSALPFPERIAQFRELFIDATRIRMRSDVPISCSFSGGIDSTAVASCIKLLQRQGLKTERSFEGQISGFLSAFPDDPLDETEFAREAAAGIELNLIETQSNAAYTTEGILKNIWTMEDVYPGIAIPVEENYRSIRNAGITVSIDGHGSDELLGGYSFYLPAPIGQLNAMLFDQFHRSLLPAILKNYDRCSMANGIEVRMPFMDYRVVTQAFSCPSSDKIGNGFTKLLLREAMKGVMPESIRTRRNKIGFNAPMPALFNGDLIPLIGLATGSHFWQANPWWDAKESSEILKRRCGNQTWSANDWGQLLQYWTQINLTLWHMIFVEDRFPHLGRR